HAFGTIDDERSLRRHERDFAHVNFLFLGPLFFAELEGNVERCAVGLALALGLERGQLWFADFVMAEIENGFFVVALDRKYFFENGLKTGSFALGKRDIFL